VQGTTGRQHTQLYVQDNEGPSKAASDVAVLAAEGKGSSNTHSSICELRDRGWSRVSPVYGGLTTAALYGGIAIQAAEAATEAALAVGDFGCSCNWPGPMNHSPCERIVFQRCVQLTWLQRAYASA
jgi:hypothetical protein